MLEAAEFVFDFQGIYFNAKKALYINFQNRDSIFCKAIISTMNGGGHIWCYVFPTNVCSNANKYLPIKDIYSGFKCQNALVNILNVSQMSVESLRQPTKPRILVGQFPNRLKGNKEAYDSIDAFIHQWKEYIGEPNAKIYFRGIASTTTIYYKYQKVLLQNHTSKHQYYVHYWFKHRYIVTKKIVTTSYTTLAEYELREYKDSLWNKSSVWID